MKIQSWQCSWRCITFFLCKLVWWSDPWFFFSIKSDSLSLTMNFMFFVAYLMQRVNMTLDCVIWDPYWVLVDTFASCIIFESSIRRSLPSRIPLRTASWIMRLSIWTAWRAPSHYLNQCWNIVNWALRNKLQWNLDRNQQIFIQENISKMSSGKWRPFCFGINVLTQRGRLNMYASMN